MPLINRVGGGGADVSGVTATAGKVWEGYDFVGADGEPVTGEIPAYNNMIHHTLTDAEEAVKFSVANNSDDGVCFTFKASETRIYPKDAELDVMVYKSDWDNAYGQTVATGLTGDVEARKITIPVENTKIPRYFSLTAMSEPTGFIDGGTYEIISMQYNQASDDFAWAVIRKSIDESYTTGTIDVVGGTVGIEIIGSNLVITLNSSLYSFVGANTNLYKYSYLIVW